MSASCRASASPPTRAPAARTPRRCETAAQKALAAEFETRAERFSACANGDIALGSDGTLRWIGAPIGTLVAGEEALKPRVILLADEQLTGPARDKVAARAERFVNFQIETLLKPLIDLKNADQITGIGRGIAFQLVENFGLINRRDIAEDVKSLDQEGRAALRRLGVRFGAYHIFVPGADQAGSGRAGHAALGAEERRQGQARLWRRRPCAGLRADLRGRRPGLRPRLLQARRLPHRSAAAPCASTFWSGWPT